MGAGVHSRTMLDLNRILKLYMLHTSAAFKREDIQNLWEEERTLNGGRENLISP